MVQSPVYVEAPPVNPLPYGLFSTALVVDETGPARFAVAGVQYQPDACGPAQETAAACVSSAQGELSVSVDNAALASLDYQGSFPGDGETFYVDWGDGSDPEAWDDGFTTLTHTYAAPDDYTVVVTGPLGFGGTVTVTVTDAEASGPFTGAVTLVKSPEDGIGVVEAAPFTLYHLFTCRAPGGVIQNGAERARAALRLGEQRGAERVVSRFLARSELAVDLTPTPGTAVHAVDALAILERYAAANYGGVPVVHVPRDVGTLLTTHGSVVRGSSSRLETVQGALVASGGGYQLTEPTADPTAPLPTPDAGEAWVYVTGQVVVRRSTVIEVGPEMAGSRQTNEFSALTERPYAVSWECIVGAVLVSTSYEVPA